MNNACVNKTILGHVGFDTEVVTIRNGKKSKKVLLTYDSFASHTTVHGAVKDELGLKANFIGNLSVQTYAGSVEEKGFQVCATIDGLQGKKKIDFLVSSCSQSIPTFKYKVPHVWKSKYNLPDHPESEAGINSITVGKDNCELFPKMLEVSSGVCISQSNITGNFILSGRASDSSESCLMANRTVVNNEEKQLTRLPERCHNHCSYFLL